MKPRNHLVAHMMKRKQGAHGRTKKAERRREKMSLKREWGA
jgi:hypothetical protein